MMPAPPPEEEDVLAALLLLEQRGWGIHNFGHSLERALRDLLDGYDQLRRFAERMREE